MSAVKTKKPTRRVFADDLAIEADGDTYRPHAGEWVEFKGRQTVDNLLSIMRISGLRLVSEDADKTRELLADVFDVLARQIVAWSWTDDDDKAYTSPPTPAILRGLDFDEILWLINASAGAKRTEEARGEGSPPST